MSDDVSADGVDVEAVMARIRERIAEKKRRGLLTDEEVREIAERPLHPVLDAHEFRSRLLAELLQGRERWGYSFSPAHVYGSSRGGAGRLLEVVRRLLVDGERSVRKGHVVDVEPDPVDRGGRLHEREHLAGHDQPVEGDGVLS